MTNDRQSLQASWKGAREHLLAARSALAGVSTDEASSFNDFLDHNELGLAFDDLVGLGEERDPPLPFWQHLDRAAREMRLYTAALNTPHLTAADLCRRRLAAADERDPQENGR